MIIVGHGKSMLEHNWGSLIDSHDIVIRQKRCSETLKDPDHFGTKTDYVCGSLTIAAFLPGDVPGCEYWAFVDSRHAGVLQDTLSQMAKYVPCTILKDLCDDWNASYRIRREPFMLPPNVKQFDPLGHPHLSAGFHTILYACEILKPKEITLVGFDNLTSGTFTWSVTRGPDWNQYPDHSWWLEHKMLPEIEDQFDVKLIKAEVPDERTVLAR